MRKYFLAERMKNRHTYTEKLLVLTPLITVLFAAWLTSDYFIIDSYNWWYMTLFPGMLALICSSVGNRDKKMENRTIWTLPVKIDAVWDGKILYGIRCMGISLLLFLGITIVISNVLLQTAGQVFHIQPTLGEQALAVAVLFVTSLWQIPFCLFLQQLIGTFPMILLHMGSYVVLSVEWSLHSFFMLLPGGITARLMCILVKILPNGLVAQPGSITFTPELLDWKGLPMGIAASVFWFLLLWLAGRRWFERQAER